MEMSVKVRVAATDGGRADRQFPTRKNGSAAIESRSCHDVASLAALAYPVPEASSNRTHTLEQLDKFVEALIG
jgi:hypothetical protein